MKKINILLLSLISLILFSCENDDKLTIASDIKSPVLETLTPENLVISESMNLYDKIANWHWTSADYGFSASIEYTIQADTSATFTNPFNIGSVKATSITITGEALNKAGLNFTSKAEPITLFVRLKAGIAADENAAYAPEVYSNIQRITFTPYPLYPSNLYMIGKDFGDWIWESTDVVNMIPVNGKDGAFWCIRYIQAENGFKWSPNKERGSDFAELDNKATGYTVKDDNAFVAKDGLYSIYVDYISKEIVIEPAKIYGIGDCFGGYNANDDNYLFTINGRTASITTANSGELRMYASIPSGSDWWTSEFILLSEKIEYRGNGNDQTRVQVDAGETVTLDFNTGTGSIK